MNYPLDFSRPTPDRLLQHIQDEEKRAHRGKLKIFFGSSAGVGKTFAMLSAAHLLLKEGVDVVAGIVETHKRSDTEKLLEGIPCIPPLEIDYRGMRLKEFNLDAAKQRKPAVLLVDEFAHTNVPGSRHPKRWNDIEELLDAGIDVYTTLNVQHIESLSDLISAATGIIVKETVPDSIFDAADDIVLVDLNVDELLKRLREGKVYIADRARINAADNFFKKSNLIALRELALRRTAERIDAERSEYDLREGIRERARVNDKILVCIGPDPLSAKLVRTAKRMASSLKAPWIAIYVETARHYRLNERGHRALRAVFRLVERMEGKLVIIQGNSVADEVLAYAENQQISKIVIGKPIASSWRRLWHGTLSDRIIVRSGAADVYVVTGEPGTHYDNIFGKSTFHQFKPQLYLWSLMAVSMTTSLGVLFQKFISASDQALIYLAGVVLVAARCGMGPAMLYALLSASCLDFFFIEPLYSLSIYDRSYWMTLFVILMTGFVIARQASQLRLQTILSRQRELNTQTLYTLTKELASARGRESVSSAVIRHLAGMMNIEATIWMSESDGSLTLISGKALGENDARETGTLQWCFDNQKIAGRATDTMPTAEGLYFPLIASTGALGVLRVVPRKVDTVFTIEEMASLETIANLLAASLERVKTAETAEKSEIQAETERLRNTLLSSVSHDLRTPLASITGASSSILMDAHHLKPETIKELAGSIQREASRLSRVVSNLLDITTLETGTIALNRQPYYIQEIIGSALAHTETTLAGHHVTTSAADDLPMVWVDGMLIEQTLQNLLENAAHYTQPDSSIHITAVQQGGKVLVSVRDNGPGIPAGEETKIFDKFYTIARRGSHKGTGLGLAICASILKSHGELLWVENNPGHGACFHFTLPVLKEAEPEKTRDALE